jgi:hypothetical protein
MSHVTFGGEARCGFRFPFSGWVRDHRQASQQ